MPQTVGTTGEKSYLIPAAEIVSFQLLLNLFDRATQPGNDYDTDWSSIKHNLESSWTTDNDPFAVNQLFHPYTGAIYHGFARSAGLNYWESLGYTFAGSALWEIAGETTEPSLNDQITTGIGGSFLGEALFRSAGWLLKCSGEKPGLAREIGAAALSPSTAFNRLAFGDRFPSLCPAEDPAVMTRLGLGAMTDTHLLDQGNSGSKEETGLLAEFAIDYGMPGKNDYHYRNPFDYFHFDVAGISDSDNHIHHASARGMLVGSEYVFDEESRGIWGLYGSYDYLSPGIFRVASTAVSLGSTARARLASNAALEGTGLLGFGYGSSGTASQDLEGNDYHYGTIPQGMLDLRLFLGESVMAQYTGRYFYVFGGPGDERMRQSDVSLLVRLIGRHAVRVGYVESWREADDHGGGTYRQSIGSLSVAYQFLGGVQLGPLK